MNLTFANLKIDAPPRLTEFRSNGNVLNATDAFSWLDAQDGDFVGFTYSINIKVWTMLQPSRLIADHINPDLVNSRIRLASCCHAKCYIGKTEMLIGSLNLVFPTIEDLCYLVKDKAAIRHMKKSFDVAWKALK